MQDAVDMATSEAPAYDPVRRTGQPRRQQKAQAMTATTSPIYRWRLGEVEITRVLEFEAALFEPAVIHPEASPEIIERHHSWLAPRLMDPVSGLMIFAFHSTLIKTPRATRRRFIETFVDRPVMIIFAHFPTPTAGWIRSQDGSFRFRFDHFR